MCADQYQPFSPLNDDSLAATGYDATANIRADAQHVRHLAGRGQSLPQAVAEALAAADSALETMPFETLENFPSEQLATLFPGTLEQLELLDDTVFEAIAGKPGAIDSLRKLWPEVLQQFAPPLIDQSRAEYVRHALVVWRQCVESEDIHNAALAVSAIEVIEVLLQPVPGESP